MYPIQKNSSRRTGQSKIHITNPVKILQGPDALLTTYCCFRGWWLVAFFCWEMKGLFLVCFGMPGLGAVCGLFCKWLPPGIRRPEANPRLPPGCRRFEPSATEDILDITLDFFPSLRCSKSLVKASCCLPTAIKNLSILSPSLNCGGE